MPNAKVLFFDMGNTLLHFHHGQTDEEKDAQGLLYLTKYLHNFNPNITISDVSNGFFLPWLEGIKDRNTIHKEYPIEGFLNDFLIDYNINLTINECIEAMHLFYTKYREQILFEVNLADSLQRIRDKGYKLGVISNTCYYDEVMKECFKAAKIYDMIDHFTFSYSLGLGKPNIQIFKIALTAMNVLPEDSIMIGDNFYSDIKPAIELGMKTIWLNPKNKIINSEIKPHFKVSSICEIINLI